MPVYWVYLTGWANQDGVANFRTDVYGVDPAAEATASAAAARAEADPAPVAVVPADAPPQPAPQPTLDLRLPAQQQPLSASRPLQNRVDPFGALHATPERGRLMGNRGGRIHDETQRIGRRRWASRQWIACVCEFKGRQRKVFGASYSELFFRDEPTALAAGHRPCFECRPRRREGVPGGLPRQEPARPGDGRDAACGAA